MNDKRLKIAIEFLEANKDKLKGLNTMQVWGICDRCGKSIGFGTSDPVNILREFRTYLFSHYRCDSKGEWDLSTRYDQR